MLRIFRQRHLVAYSLIAAVLWLALSAVCFYMCFVLIQIQIHTPTCVLMGTCSAH